MFSGKLPYARPNAISTFLGMAGIEEIHGGGVLPFEQVGSPGPA